MSAILNFIEQQGWSARDLALPGLTVEPCLRKRVGSAWWRSWPLHLRRACAYSGLVYEVQTLPGCGASSFALTALLLAQEQQQDKEQRWLLGIESPESQFNGAALSALGLSQETFVVARPPVNDVPLVALQAVKSGLFIGVFIDLNYKAALRRWRNTSRRLLLAARDTQTMVWLQTNKNEKRSRPIWSHVKIEIGATQKELCVEIKKHKEGSAPWQGVVAHPVYHNFLNCRRIFCHTPK